VQKHHSAVQVYANSRQPSRSSSSLRHNWPKDCGDFRARRRFPGRPVEDSERQPNHTAP